MRRPLRAVAGLALASSLVVAGAPPAGAGPGGAPVRGEARGEAALYPQQAGCIAVTVHDGTLTASVLGAGAYHLEACAYWDTVMRVAGVLTITTPGGHVLTAGLDEVFYGALDTTFTVTGGTGRFRRATGTLTLRLEAFDQRNCHPRVGVCLNWSEQGPVTGTVRLGA